MMQKRESSAKQGDLGKRKSWKEEDCCLKLNYNEYRLSFRERIRCGLCGAASCAAAAFTFYKSVPVFFLLLIPDQIIYPRVMKKKLCQKRISLLGMQFREAIGVLGNCTSAGLSVENAFLESWKEMKKVFGSEAMICRELEAICHGIRLNRPPEELLLSFADRSGIPEIKNFAEVFAIAKRSGGDMRPIIERTAAVIREKMAVAEEIRTVTASRQYEQKIMNVLPFAMIAYINASSGDFLAVLYEGAAGRIVMTVCLMMLMAASLLQKRILDIQV